jgi:hypothetical protein
MRDQADFLDTYLSEEQQVQHLVEDFCDTHEVVAFIRVCNSQKRLPGGSHQGYVRWASLDFRGLGISCLSGPYAASGVSVPAILDSQNCGCSRKCRNGLARLRTVFERCGVQVICGVQYGANRPHLLGSACPGCTFPEIHYRDTGTKGL